MGRSVIVVVAAHRIRQQVDCSAVASVGVPQLRLWVTGISGLVSLKSISLSLSLLIIYLLFVLREKGHKDKVAHGLCVSRKVPLGDEMKRTSFLTKT